MLLPEWVWVLLSIPTLVSVAVFSWILLVAAARDRQHRKRYGRSRAQVLPPPGVNGYPVGRVRRQARRKL